MQERTVRHYGSPSVWVRVIFPFFFLKTMCAIWVMVANLMAPMGLYDDDMNTVIFDNVDLLSMKAHL